MLTVPYAMPLYVLERLARLEGARLRVPRTQDIGVADEGEVAAALERTQHEFDEADVAGGAAPK